MTVDQIQADCRRMKRFICERISLDGIRIVLADGEDGPAWADLLPVWDDGDCDLLIETNEPEWAGLRVVYDYIRCQEMTWTEWMREMQGDLNRWRIYTLEKEISLLRGEAGRLSAASVHESVEFVGTEDDGELPKEVGTAEAASILGVSKDTLLKLKQAGLLEYRNSAPPDSFRPVYAFSLRSVMEIRTTYERDVPTPRRQTEPPRRQIKAVRKYKHLKLND
jgi:hypothetical protein